MILNRVTAENKFGGAFAHCWLLVPLPLRRDCHRRRQPRVGKLISKGLAMNAYVLIPTRWLDDRRIMQLSDTQFKEFVWNYAHDPANIRYEINPRRLAWQRIKSIRKQQLLERDEYKCNYCGSYNRIEIDHIKPISKGGTNDLDNLQFLCKPCNLKKRDHYNG
jgi:5-methylcytosine-specific restriction enzyme A